MIGRAGPVLLLLVGAVAGCPAPQPPPPPGGPPPQPVPEAESGTRLVVRVVDGDTVVLNGGDRVRISQINTPEIDEEYGPEARDVARTLVLKKMVSVEGNKHDHYGRLVGDLAFEGKSLAVEMVARGLAHVYLIPPIDRDRAQRLIAAQKGARKQRLGIWATSRYKGLFHITSFHANPRGNDNFNLNGEYVRIASIADRPQSLRGWYLANRKGERYTYGDVIVPPGHTVMTHSGGGKDQTDPAKQLKVFWNRTVGAWTNKGDTATLHDPQGQVVDQVVYDPHKRKKY